MEAAISLFGKHDNAMTQVHLRARRLVQQTKRLLTTGTHNWSLVAQSSGPK